MSDVNVDELIERLRMLARNRIAQGHTEITIGKFVIGEDLPTGNLAVDVLGGSGRRYCFVMINRDGELSRVLKDKDWDLLAQLSQQMVLEELANI